MTAPSTPPPVVLRCACGATLTVQGSGIVEQQLAVDAAGWSHVTETAHGMMRSPAVRCAACRRHR